MKRRPTITPAQKVIRQISDLRDLARRLARAGFEAGLHKHDPDKLPWENKPRPQAGTLALPTTRRRRK
jgi:hypothetical protein